MASSEVPWPVSTPKVQEYATGLLVDHDIDVEDGIEWMGTGEMLDLVPISQLSRRWRQLGLSLRKPGTRLIVTDLRESPGALHRGLRDLPIEVLDDPHFWRYLTFGHFWWLVSWRESNAFAGHDYSRYRTYVDAMNPSECVLTRMFLRGQFRVGRVIIRWLQRSRVEPTFGEATCESVNQYGSLASRRPRLLKNRRATGCRLTSFVRTQSS